MDTLLNILIFLVVSGGMLTGGYLLLKKFVPETAAQIKVTVDGLLAGFKKK